MLDAFGPGHIGNMNKAVDSLFQFDKGTEGRQIPDLAIYHVTDREFIVQCKPRIRLNLFHAQGNLFILRIDLKHHGFYILADCHNFRRVRDMLGPGHFGDMDQPLNTLFQFDKSTVIGNADHPAGDNFVNRITLFHVGPGIRLQLLQTKRDTFPFTIKIKNGNHDLLADVHQFRGMTDASP